MGFSSAHDQRQGQRDKKPKQSPAKSSMLENDCNAIPFAGGSPANAKAHEFNELVAAHPFHTRAKPNIALVRKMKNAVVMKSVRMVAAPKCHRRGNAQP